MTSNTVTIAVCVFVVAVGDDVDVRMTVRPATELEDAGARICAITGGLVVKTR